MQEIIKTVTLHNTSKSFFLPGHIHRHLHLCVFLNPSPLSVFSHCVTVLIRRHFMWTRHFNPARAEIPVAHRTYLQAEDKSHSELDPSEPPLLNTHSFSLLNCAEEASSNENLKIRASSLFFSVFTVFLMCCDLVSFSSFWTCLVLFPLNWQSRTSVLTCHNEGKMFIAQCNVFIIISVYIVLCLSLRALVSYFIDLL